MGHYDIRTKLNTRQFKISPVMSEPQIFRKSEFLKITADGPYQRHFIYVSVIPRNRIAFCVRKLNSRRLIVTAFHRNVLLRIRGIFSQHRRITTIAYVNLKIVHYIIIYEKRPVLSRSLFSHNMIITLMMRAPS